jgi:hypothetical protein
MTAAIRPIQFSALKVLDRLNEEEERGEDDDRHADDEQIVHVFIKALVRRLYCGPDGSYAAGPGFLTDPMRAPVADKVYLPVGLRWRLSGDGPYSRGSRGTSSSGASACLRRSGHGSRPRRISSISRDGGTASTGHVACARQ